MMQQRIVTKTAITNPKGTVAFVLGLLLTPIESVMACSLQFTSPQRGATVFNSTTSVSGNGSGTANPGAVGTVSATINGVVFFQRRGAFTSLINFFGSGAASVNLKEGANIISVNGSVEGCSASDSMVIYYEPQLNGPDKNEGSPECSTGNPINIATGNKYQLEIDYRGSHIIPSFQRSYNSSSANADHGMGYGWTSITLKRLVTDGNALLVQHDSGKSESFVKTAGVWQGDADSKLTIQEDSTGFIVEKPKGEIEHYNSQGQLVSQTNRFKQTTVYAYGSLGLMTSITSAFGHIVQLNYDNDGRLALITDPLGNDYRYSYDAIGNLRSVSYPDETPLDNNDDPTRIYHYENNDFPHHLTGITDETGIRYVTWGYDEGRAISSEHAGGVDKFSLLFNADDSVTKTNPLGKETTYHFTTLHGVKKVTQVKGHATERCTGANQHYSYDANGYLASKTDWQGNMTTYIHDVKGQEISRTEAAGTSEARTITTDWHARFRLPIKITEPSKITDYSYDTQGRLTSQTSHTP